MTVQYITKRNGDLQKFDINKVLQWELWACWDIKEHIDWRDIILKVKSQFRDKMSTQEIQLKLIDECNSRQTWLHGIVAGRLYAAYISKKIHGSPYPTVKELQDKLVAQGYMRDMGYSDQEYAVIEKMIDHSKNYNLNYIQVYQLVNKYSLSDRVSKVVFETPQFIFMRMAMDLSAGEPDRLTHVRNFYQYLSDFKLNAPTPNYLNLGTNHNGYISCCLYTTGDTAESLAVGDHIAYTMTYMSAGIGGFLNTRSINDQVKNGAIKHMGKLPYFTSVGAAVNANTQGGRGGACTQYFSVYDPEVTDIVYLQNPRTPITKQNRSIHFAIQLNDFFIEKVYNKEKIFTFNTYTAPELHEAIFSSDNLRFKQLYQEKENDPKFKKTYIDAEQLAVTALRQCHEVATLYAFNASEVNRHTPFKDPIKQSNLCLEIVQPTKPYMNMQDLYSTEKHDRGEISLCGLGGIIPSNIKSDEEYEKVAYYALLMIDICIHKNHYVFPHLEYTGKSRLNAAVGMIGVAYDLAKNGLTYTSKEGLQYLHWLGERHSYSLIKASIRLGKERGNAAWMNKTKWPEGWLPIDTYKKDVDEGMDFTYRYDWEKLRSELIENKGMRFSALVAHMPTESSSKTSGLPNGVYPVRAVYLKKTDGSAAIDYIVKDSDTIADKYDIAWGHTPEQQMRYYGVIQKFTDQTISADIYSDRTDKPELKSSRLLDELFWMYKFGVKTRYYTNSKTTKGLKLEDMTDERGCSGGSCTL